MAGTQDDKDKKREQTESSQVFRFDSMPRHLNQNGSESRTIFHGQLATGEQVNVHETSQPAGLAANPAHTIAHTECICVREGTLEFMHNGVVDRATVGDMIFVAKGTLHSVRNVGEGQAAYFVVQIGGDTNGGKK